MGIARADSPRTNSTASADVSGRLTGRVGTRLAWLIAIATLVRAVAAARVPLIDDEAYYWLWSRRLDWGYLDHPPLIAYLVALTTWPGSHPLLIRLSALLIGALTTFLLYVLARTLFDEPTGLRAALLFQIVPVLAGGALLATPDAPLFAAWTAMLLLAWRALHGQSRTWFGVGAAVGAGLLSKLPMTFGALGLAGFVALRHRRYLSCPHPYLAAAIAIALFMPVIVWNATHDWAMVRFVLYQRPGGTPHGVPGILELAVQQFAFALLLFPACIWAAWAAWARRADERYAFLLWTSMPVIVFSFAAAATTGAPHGNWLGPGYLGLVIILGALWNRAVASAAAVSAAVILYGLAVPLIPALPPLPGAEELVGWREAAARVEQERSPGTVIVADRYQVAAQLGYYTGDRIPVVLLPCPNPASIWQPVDRFQGADGVAVIDRRWAPAVRWEDHAGRVEERPLVSVAFHGRPLRTFTILHLRGLRGNCSAR